MGRKAAAKQIEKEEEKELLYNKGDVIAVHESEDSEGFTLVVLRDDVEDEHQDVRVQYFDRVKNNHFRRGQEADVSCDYFIMQVPATDLTMILPEKDEDATPVDWDLMIRKAEGREQRRKRLMMTFHLKSLWCQECTSASKRCQRNSSLLNQKQRMQDPRKKNLNKKKLLRRKEVRVRRWPRN